MKNLIVSIEAVIGGVIIALLTGLANTTPGGGFVGASWYGWPVSWLYKLVIAPQYNPWKVQWGNLIIDIIVWIVVVAVVMLIAEHVMGHGKKPAASKKGKGKSKK
ncbi:MAG TPA: hypothetical protein VND15_02085 [Candidatus Acidoferrales bacterium]|nr:hypothetical protein [Candidatus Acidoferrales bacterium]